jgi:hypothetical protein
VCCLSDLERAALEGLKPKYFTGPNAGRQVASGHIAIASVRVRPDGG